jgi:hypothetical protein
MIVVPDLELTVRLGALDPGTVAAVRGLALDAARRGGLRDPDGLHVVRRLHWLAVGHRPDSSAEHMVALLFLTPAPPETYARLAAALEEAYADTAAERGADGPGDPLGITDRWRLGRRVSIALELVQDEELKIARRRTSESAP